MKLDLYSGSSSYCFFLLLLVLPNLLIRELYRDVTGSSSIFINFFPFTSNCLYIGTCFEKSISVELTEPLESSLEFRCFFVGDFGSNYDCVDYYVVFDDDGDDDCGDCYVACE